MGREKRVFSKYNKIKAKTDKGVNMPIQGKIISGKYLDSVKLMLISKEIRQREGVLDAVAIMSTPENKSILKATNMLLPEFETAKDMDICIAVKTEDEKIIPELMELLQTWIEKGLPNTKAKSDKQVLPRSIETAQTTLPEANLALISVAGKYAASEAHQALDLGLNVMLFSDNVSLEDELALKEKAITKDLLMMGPDCGTAIINGTPLAFANVVRSGKIGIVSASGTGLQEVSSIIHNLGEGISQAFGTGGRDGKKEIGGLMIINCLKYLIEDENTSVIVLISKVPDAEVAAKIMEVLKTTSKPVIVNFLKVFDFPVLPNLYPTDTLADTAYAACSLLHEKENNPIDIPRIKPKGSSYRQLFKVTIPKAPRTWLRGIYSGGTLCYEAQRIFLKELGISANSNAPLEAANKLADVWKSKEDTIIDIGADEFTVGRPHPMIDYSLRLKKLEEESNDPETAVILLDIVLGYGSHLTPHLELAPVIKKITSTTDIIVICAVVGTDGDPQNRHDVTHDLKECGAIVSTTNAEACEIALEIIHALRRS